MPSRILADLSRALDRSPLAIPGVVTLDGIEHRCRLELTNREFVEANDSGMDVVNMLPVVRYSANAMPRRLKKGDAGIVDGKAFKVDAVTDLGTGRSEARIYWT